MALARYTGTARASAALPAAGAYDSSPTQISCDTFNELTFLVRYTRGGAGGAVTYKVEFSNDASIWYQNSDTEIGDVTAGSDTINLTQRAESSYQATSASAENFTTQTFTVLGNFCRIVMKESGAVGTPGTASCEFYLRRDV